ncbi:FAD-binding oxidoreductase, partial [Streptomyces boncukensis]
VAGGGYGPLCRLFGLVSDHLYAVEVVVADRRGQVRGVVATREEDDPNRDLWWAHTGGGCGAFGVVTRFWFRSPGATRDTEPDRMLPAPPATALTFTGEWSWEGMDHERFARMVRNHGRWAERHAGAGDKAAALYAEFALTRRAAGAHRLRGQVAAEHGGDRRLLHEFIGAISAGTSRPATLTVRRLPWLTAALHGSGEPAGDGHGHTTTESAFLRRRFTDRQIGVLHRHLTRTDTGVVAGRVAVNTYGGAVNTPSPGDTATAHRDSVLNVSHLASWEKPEQAPEYLSWIRECHRDLFARTGGDSALVPCPDTDPAGPDLCFRQNAARLRRVKARWDPRDVFRHALSPAPE